MKHYLIGTFLAFGLVSSVMAENGFQASLVDTKIYKGDDGETNSCNSNKILVQEIYKFTNSDINGIIAAYWSNSSGLEMFRIDLKLINTNYLGFAYCKDRNYKSNVQVKFMNSSGKTSNTVSFSINLNQLKLHNATEYHPMQKIE